MSEVYDVVVIGAGMFGSAAAKYLSRAGARTLVVGPAEPQSQLTADRRSFAAHYDEARITRRLGWDDVWASTDSRSLERFREIETGSGVPFFHESGSLVLMAASVKHRTDAILRQCERDGIGVERLSEDDLARRIPALGFPALEGGVEGLFESDRAGYVNPRGLVRAQLELTRQAGGTLLRAAVTGVRKDRASGLWVVGIREGERSFEVRAEKTLVATGAFTNHNDVLPENCWLEMYAFSEPNVLYEVREADLPSMEGLPAVVVVDPEDTGDDNRSLYLLPPIRYPDGRWYLRIGPGMQPMVEELTTVEQMSDWYARQEVTPLQRASLSAMMDEMVPGARPASVRSACCIIEKTPSQYPYIGPVTAEEDVHVVVGGNGHGARGSDEIGRLASTLVLGQAWDSPVARKTFDPIVSAHPTIRTGERPGFLKPPFGLC